MTTDAEYAAWLSAARIEDQPDPTAFANAAGHLKTRPRVAIPASYVVKAVREARKTGQETFSGLRMRDLTIEGDLRLESYEIPFPLHFIDCWFTGEIYLWQAKTRSLVFRGCRFEKGADLTGTKIDGHLILRDGFVSDGPIVARDMRVEGQIDMSGASFAYRPSGDADKDAAQFGLAKRADGECFGFSRSQASALYWRHFASKPEGIVTLRDVHVGTFMHDLPSDPDFPSWPPKGKLLLDGFRYDRMASEEKEPLTVERAVAWLDLSTGFSDDAYVNLARAYKKNSQIEAAEDVLTALKKREIQNMKFSGRKIFYGSTYWAIGYGKTPSFALLLLALLFAVSVGASYLLQATGYIEPSVNEFLLEPCYYYKPPQCEKSKFIWKPITVNPGTQTRYVPEPYPAFSPMAYALESFVPVLNFDQKKYWEPSTLLIQGLFALISALGIFLGGVFVGGISGFLTPRASDL